MYPCILFFFLLQLSKGDGFWGRGRGQNGGVGDTGDHAAGWLGSSVSGRGRSHSGGGIGGGGGCQFTPAAGHFAELIGGGGVAPDPVLSVSPINSPRITAVVRINWSPANRRH